MPRKDFRVVRDRFARDEGLPFGRLLTRDYVLSVLELEGHKYRSRTFCPLVTLWGWLSQCLSQDKSLNEAVSRIVAHRVATGLPPCSASSASYSEARCRFPVPVMVRMAKEIGRRIHDSAADDWKWHGREVFLADGTCLVMSDTPDNQAVWPQNGACKKGIGFPIMRAVALISMSTGSVVDLAFDQLRGKGTGEVGLLIRMLDSMGPRSIVVADRYYPSFFTAAMLLNRGVDLVSISHHARKIDFSKGESLGPKDHIVEWKRPSLKDCQDKQAHASLPETIKVREFCLEIEAREGGTIEAVFVTTMIDKSLSQKEISDLYWRRWNCELDIRSIKHSLHLDFVRAKTPDMVRKDIWCHMLAWNLLRGVMVESAKRHEVLPRQLSVKGAMQAVES